MKNKIGKETKALSRHAQKIAEKVNLLNDFNQLGWLRLA